MSIGYGTDKYRTPEEGYTCEVCGMHVYPGTFHAHGGYESELLSTGYIVRRNREQEIIDRLDRIINLLEQILRNTS